MTYGEYISAFLERYNMEMFNAFVCVVFVFLIVFSERKKPGEALLWILFVVLIPPVGALCYLIFGSTLGFKIIYRIRGKKVYEPFLAILNEQFIQHKDNKSPVAFSKEEEQAIHFNLLYAKGGLGLYNEVEILTTGKDKYARLFDDIAQAQNHIHIAYYSIHNDRTGELLVESLVRKAREGVAVKVLCDGIGSFGVRRRLFQPLLEAGGEVAVIKPLLTHFRYHRKIVVLDGRIGYTGGMNIGDKYLGENPKKSPWRDTQVRIVGESVLMLQYFFLYDWLFANSVSQVSSLFENAEELFHQTEITAELPCQIIGSGVDTDMQTIKLCYVRLISLAQKRIVIQTPYFIPSLTLFEVLKVVLSSGVEVILHTSKAKANFFLDPVTRYYIAQLVPLGLRVYLYEGYIHAKTLTIDDTITCIGSVNIDIRSLEVDDEICAVFYSESFSQRHDAILLHDFSHSQELDYEALSHRPLRERAIERFFLLFSPLM